IQLTSGLWRLQLALEAQLGVRSDYGDPIVLLPVLMPREQEGFHLCLVVAPRQFCVSKAASQIGGGVAICMVAEMTDHASKGALIRPVPSVDVVATLALL